MSCQKLRLSMYRTSSFTCPGKSISARPPLPREVALYTLADRRRLAITPGITCLWQISGRAEIDFPGQVKLDVRYIESRSFWQDIKILCKTVPAVLSGNGAY